MRHLVVRWLQWLRRRRPRRLTTRASIYVRHPLPEDGGWLAPDGTFVTCVGSHQDTARLILQERGVLEVSDPERELEQRGYAKYSDGVWIGWHARHRLTRPQRDYIVDWYIDRRRRLPEWLLAHY